MRVFECVNMNCTRQPRRDQRLSSLPDVHLNEWKTQLFHTHLVQLATSLALANHMGFKKLEVCLFNETQKVLSPFHRVSISHPGELKMPPGGKCITCC